MCSAFERAALWAISIGTQRERILIGRFKRVGSDIYYRVNRPRPSNVRAS